MDFHVGCSMLCWHVTIFLSDCMLDNAYKVLVNSLHIESFFGDA